MMSWQLKKDTLSSFKLPSGLEPYFFRLSLLYWLILFSANLVRHQAFQLFHFIISSGTVLFSLALMLVIVMAEIYPAKRMYKMVCLASLLNTFAALVVYDVLKIPLPYFWVKEQMASMAFWPQLAIILMLMMGHVLTSVMAIFCLDTLKKVLNPKWLFCRLLVTFVLAAFVDLLCLFPIINYVSPDLYMTGWKMISLFSIKMYFIFFLLPASILILFLANDR